MCAEGSICCRRVPRHKKGSKKILRDPNEYRRIPRGSEGSLVPRGILSGQRDLKGYIRILQVKRDP